METSYLSRLLLLLLYITTTRAYDLGLFEPAKVADRRPGLQIALYKFYTKLHSVPDFDSRRPDLITWLPLLNQPARFGAWPEVNAMNATPTPGFERYDGRTYGECTRPREYEYAEKRRCTRRFSHERLLMQQKAKIKKLNKCAWFSYDKTRVPTG